MERLPANATVCKERIGAYEQMQEPAMTVIYQGFWCCFFGGLTTYGTGVPERKTDGKVNVTVLGNMNWLVVWNIWIFFPYIGNSYPN